MTVLVKLLVDDISVRPQLSSYHIITLFSPFFLSYCCIYCEQVFNSVYTG